MNSIQQMAIKAAVNKMLNDGYVSICTINKILASQNMVPNKEDYAILDMLHCVPFKDMDKDLLRGLPIILNRVLSSESISFEFHNRDRVLLLEL